MTYSTSSLDDLYFAHKEDEILTGLEKMPTIGKTAGRVYLALHSLWNKAQNNEKLEKAFIVKATSLLPAMSVKTSAASTYMIFLTERAQKTPELRELFADTVTPLFIDIADTNRQAALQLARMTLKVLRDLPKKQHAFTEACIAIASLMQDAQQETLYGYTDMLLQVAQRNLELRPHIITELLPCIGVSGAHNLQAGLYLAEQALKLSSTDTKLQQELEQQIQSNGKLRILFDRAASNQTQHTPTAPHKFSYKDPTQGPRKYRPR